MERKPLLTTRQMTMITFVAMIIVFGEVAQAAYRQMKSLSMSHSRAVCGINFQDTVECWGSVRSTNYFPGYNITFITTYDNVVCGIDNLGDVYCRAVVSYFTNQNTGQDSFGILKINIGLNRKAKQIGLNEKVFCVLDTTKQVVCFGDANLAGRYGETDTKAPSDPTTVVPAIDLNGRDVSSIKVAAFFVCVLFEDNDGVACFGENGGDGRLGTGNTDSVGDGPGEMGSSLKEIDFGDDMGGVSDFVLGANGGMYISKATGRIKSIGGNAGYEDNNPRGSTTDSLGNNLLFLSLPYNTTIRSMARTATSSCVVFEVDKKVYCFGSNVYGKLGIGNGQAVGDAPFSMGTFLHPVLLPSGSQVKSVHGGIDTMCALLETSNHVICWGDCSNFQCGYDYVGEAFNIGDSPDDIFEPAVVDTNGPTQSPTTSKPSFLPTQSPSTSKPSKAPSRAPTINGTYAPTFRPTSNRPSNTPSLAPSKSSAWSHTISMWVFTLVLAAVFICEL